MNDDSVHVHILGAPTITWAGRPVRLGATSARLLLGYLLLHRRRPQPRLKVIGVLWPDMAETRARRALSQALWLLRRSLPEALFQITSETLHIPPDAPVWVDVEAFRAFAARGLAGGAGPPSAEALDALREAARLYRGPLMEGFYEDWVLIHREQLHETYLQVLQGMLRGEKAAGRYEQALEAALRLTQDDALNEAAHREVMRLYHLLARPQAALRQFRICRRALRDQLGLEPSPATAALAREIARRAEPTPGSYLPPSSARGASEFDGDPLETTALVGRDAPRRALLLHLERALAGQGGLILLGGEAGVGKTRLMQEIARDAKWRGADVQWARCHEPYAGASWAPLLQALNAYLTPLRIEQLRGRIRPLWLQVLKPFVSALAETRPELAAAPPLEPAQERQRLSEALLHVWVSLARITPLLLILEDVHWADAETLDWLPLLARRAQEESLLVLCSYRSEDARTSPTVWPRLQALDRAGVRMRLVLPRLTPEATATLIRQCLGLREPAPVFEQRIFRETSGNPLFVLETLRALQDEGVLRRDAHGRWYTPWDETTVSYAELPLPRAVEQVISRRLDRLPSDLRGVLEMAAVLGRAFTFSALAAATNRTPAWLSDATRVLKRWRFLEETPHGYRFGHEKIREVLLARLSPDARARAHARAAAALESQGQTAPDVLAYHFAQAHLWEKAVHYHTLAARRAVERHDVLSARQHFSEALALAEKSVLPDEQRFALLAGRERILDILGEREHQLDDLNRMQALAQGDAARACRVALRRAMLLAHLGDYEQALAEARRARSLSRRHRHIAAQAESLNVLGTVLNWKGRIQESIASLREAIARARQVADPVAETRYRRDLASALLGLREYDAAREELERARQQALAHGDLLEQAEIENLLGILLMERGNLEQAHHAYQRSLQLSREIGYRYGEARAQVNLGNLHYFRGELEQTWACYRQAVGIFESLGETRGEMQVRLNRASIFLSLCGVSPQVLSDAQRTLDTARRVGDTLMQGQALIVRGSAARQQGHRAQAREDLTRGVQVLQATGDQWLLVQAYRSLAALELDEARYPQAQEYLDRALTISRHLGMTHMEAPLLALKGWALACQGRIREGLQSAEAAMHRLEPDVEQGYLIPYRYAQVLQAAGRAQDARRAIARAYRLLQQALAPLSPEQRQRSLQNVPEHRAIVAAWQQAQPKRVTVSLPSADAPRRRVSVVWTLEAPEDAQIRGKVARRRHRLRRLLAEARQQGARPTHDDLMRVLRVSRRTLERDMAALRHSPDEPENGGSNPADAHSAR